MNFIDAAAKGFAGALNGALGPVFIVILSIAAIGALIATMLYVPASARWPSLKRTNLRAAAAGAGLSVMSSLATWAMAIPIPHALSIGIKTLAAAMPYAAALAATVALAFHIYHRATFSTPRAIAIASAILVPVIFFTVMSAI